MNVNRTKKDIQLSDVQWERYRDAMQQGHEDYQKKAKEEENFYLGGGLQWSEEVKDELETLGRPWLEENLVFSTVNTVLGYQTQSRMDIAYKPRDPSDQEMSDVITKIGMLVVDDNRYPWQESQVFADGMIQRRGYFDIRMDFEENVFGDIKITTLDPLDVLPDPDAKSYDPSEWNDVMITRWVPVDDIKVLYGPAIYRKVLAYAPDDEREWGRHDYGVERNRFGNDFLYDAYHLDQTDTWHVRVLERQWMKLTKREFFYDLETGDMEAVPDGLKEAEKNRIAKEQDLEIISRTVRRIRWTITTRDVVLHDDWSPYEFYTIVPFFPYFRRGKTVGMVTNLIKTQEMLNKVFSQNLHTVNSTSNSGWIVEQNSLVNMDVEDLETDGSKTGMVIEYKTGRAPPQKIEPNPVPPGLNNMVNMGVDLMRLISGVSETFQGGKGPEVSGAAIQSRVHQSAVQLAGAIDNLFRTRTIIAEKILWMIQNFYTNQRVLVITKEGEEEEDEVLVANAQGEDGEIYNDLTKGKYDIVIADVPTQISFQNAQFQEAVEMRKFGVQIPDDEMIRLSTLARKDKIAEKISGQAQQQVQQQQLEMQMKEMEAKISNLEGKTTKDKATAQKIMSDVAKMLQENPSAAPYLDQMLEGLEQVPEDTQQPMVNQQAEPDFVPPTR